MGNTPSRNDGAAAVAGPQFWQRLEDRTARQGTRATALATATIVAAGTACLYACAFWLSLPRGAAAALTKVAMSGADFSDPAGMRGANFDAGDTEFDMQSQEFEPPADPPPAEFLPDFLPALDRADFADLNRDGVAGGGRPGGPAGLGPIGDGPSDGDPAPAVRWQIEYGTGDRRQYARMLDFFGIKLAACRGEHCRAAEGFSAGASAQRFDQAPSRQFFQFRDAARLRADRELLAAAGVAVAAADVLCQFFPDPVVEQLRKLERDYAGRSREQIAATRFGIRAAGDRRFEFFVIEQVAR